MMTALPRKQRPTPTQSVVVGVTLANVRDMSLMSAARCVCPSHDARPWHA